MEDWKENLTEVVQLLESPNLVWSGDFDAIRPHLWALVKAELRSLAPHQATLDLCETLLDLEPVFADRLD